ncbi:hypothetical protein OHB05_00355 [Streptomyces sp. NBC_00638]|uniref:hypothetical protein n=1 Tax=unclassified Streptomyces TaxID=2593676 RepID=UPI00225A5E35|nr:hypothetical protein [Streptomyces sp. NBC_00638]MCX5001081.1 hypothetical protein [Streptomyces sp. NBC_00638]
MKHELVLTDFQVRSGQAIQREPPVVSDPLSSGHHRPRGTAPGLYDSAGAASQCGPAPDSPAIAPVKGFGISLCWSP